MMMNNVVFEGIKQTPRGDFSARKIFKVHQLFGFGFKQGFFNPSIKIFDFGFEFGFVQSLLKTIFLFFFIVRIWNI